MDDGVGALKGLESRLVVGTLSRPVLAAGARLGLFFGPVDFKDAVEAGRRSDHGFEMVGLSEPDDGVSPAVDIGRDGGRRATS